MDAMKQVIVELRKQRKKLESDTQRIDNALQVLNASGKRSLSKAARARISATQKERWAKYHKAHRKVA